MHFVRRKQFSETNVISHAFQQISDLKIFPACFRGPMKTVWRATRALRACMLDHTDLSKIGFARTAEFTVCLLQC